MSDTFANNKRIAKNTLILYFRMAVTMLIQLYTSRIVLQALGIDDYGIYNIVGTVVVMFSFISNPLGTATQRFYNYELGKENEGELNKVFNISLGIFIIMAVVMSCLMEPVGYWYIFNKMNMPVERTSAAFYAFQFSLVSFLFSLLRTPYESMIIANERMAFFAYVSIIEVFLKLVNAFSLTILGFDKLILFTFNQLLITIICVSCMIVYSRKHFVAVKIKRVWDTSLFRQLLSFTGWSLFGAATSMSADQGVSLVINNYCGVAVNAAVGIANQIGAIVNQFVGNFQVAFRPQIVKLYSRNEIEPLIGLITNSAKYSYLLLFVIACPVIFNIDFLLEIWLGTVPKYTSEFVIWNIAYILLESISAPLWMAIQATGRIKKYQLVISSVMLLNIILAVIFLSIGFPPYIVMIVKCCLDIIYFTIRFSFVYSSINISLRGFSQTTILPVMIVTAFSFVYYYLLMMAPFSGWGYLILGTILFVLLYIPIVLLLCVEKKHRNYLMYLCKNKFVRK
ncbi:lipopolysaccharide biosynthesis protein [Bacteroides acidifaciens]|uniref:lipopolysaccharide biosynthesis protein n=1 Tax=Bacteroides acidifaciens TaxID=85831 RepID=UPI0030144A59